MRLAIWLMLMTLCGGVYAEQPSPQSWQFAHVMRSTDLLIYHGHGSLERTPAGLAGVLKSTDVPSYHIAIEVQGARATATFWPLESDTDARDLHGTFHQLVVGGDCWQTIQVQDGLHSFMLARNIPRCEP